MTTASAALAAGGDQHRRSPFSGADICAEAGLRLPPGTSRPMFEHQVWDFTAVIGLPAQLAASGRRLDFTTITSPRWRLVAKELMFALLVPRHDSVVVLPRALRAPLHLVSCRQRLHETIRLLNWLTGRGITSLAQMHIQHCEEYLVHRSHRYAGDGQVTGDLSPATRRSAAQAILDLISYRDLFTTDQVGEDLRPWSGRSSSAVGGLRSGGQNKTPPLAGEILQPMLGAALYLAGTLAPHIVTLTRQTRTVRRAARLLPKPGAGNPPASQLITTLDCHIQGGIPLPQLTGYDMDERIAAGWAPDDPVLPVSLNQLAIEAGVREFPHAWLASLRPAIQAALTQAGTCPPFGRDAAIVSPAAGGGTQIPWTLPLHSREVTELAGIARTAVIVVVAAVSGMRASELMELKIGCRLPVEEIAPGLARYRLDGTIVKGQPLGGTTDQWVVIEPVYRAVELAEQLHDDPRDGALLLGRFSFSARYRSFREWVNGPAGQRLGLSPIPGGHVNLRILRRTLAQELAYRPGGLLAARIHLKHVSVATTEGYASRPGGAQARLLAEVNAHEAERNLQLVLEEFRNYQHGVLPAGPGAGELAGFFAHVDGQTAAGAQAPRVQRSEREILNLLSKRAATLHLGVANYCSLKDRCRAVAVLPVVAGM